MFIGEKGDVESRKYTLYFVRVTQIGFWLYYLKLNILMQTLSVCSNIVVSLGQLLQDTYFVIPILNELTTKACVIDCQFYRKRFWPS